MISIEIKGGLGNQLFQMFHLIAYCKKYNKQFCFSDAPSTSTLYFIF